MPLNIAHPESLDVLLSRRSVKASRLQDPAPNATQLKSILDAGMRVPDHGKLTPWRFIVVDGDNRQRLSEKLTSTYINEVPADAQGKLESLKTFAHQAPLLVIVTFKPSCDDTKNIPEWEQWLSVGAACQNILVATHALGYAANWLTGWSAQSEGVRKCLGLDDGERVAAFIFMGTADEEPRERPRPDYDNIVRYLTF